MMGDSLHGLSIIECEVGKLSILNWMNADSEEQGSVKVELHEVSVTVETDLLQIKILLMPIQKESDSGDEKNLVEQEKLNSLDPVHLQELDDQLDKAKKASLISGLYSEFRRGLTSYSTDVMNSFAKNLEISLHDICLKIMLCEIKEDQECKCIICLITLPDDGSTIHLKINEASLKKSDSQSNLLSADTQQCLLHNKEFSIKSVRVFMTDSPHSDEPSLEDVSNLLNW